MFLVEVVVVLDEGGEGEGGCSLDRVAAISVSVSASGRLMVLYVRGGQGLRGELGEIGGGISLHITFFCSISPPTSTRRSATFSYCPN